jgi:dolichol-phosphate mannosyltransferase
MNFDAKFKLVNNLSIKNIIAIPSYNEIDALPGLIFNISRKLSSEDLIIILDDSDYVVSKKLEDSVKINFKNSKGQLVFLNFGKKNGRGAAIRKGMELSRIYFPKFKYFIECDADESHQVADILKIKNYSVDCDMLIGSRYLKESAIENWPLLRRIFSKILNSLIPVLLNINVTDITNGLRRYNNQSVDLILNFKQLNFGFTYLSEQALIVRAKNLKILEIPITFVNRNRGNSTVGLREIYSSIQGVFLLLKKKQEFYEE